MLRNLVIIRIKSMFAGMFSREKKKAGKGRLILFALLGVYLLVCFGVMFGGIFFSICDVFADMGLSWLYFGFMGILVFVLCFVGSVFITQNQLYEAKDNDLLLSMPIPVKYILISRLLSIVILNYIYELMIILPGAVVYCIRQPVHPAGAVFFLISFLVLAAAGSDLFGAVRLDHCAGQYPYAQQECRGAGADDGSVSGLFVFVSAVADVSAETY